MPQTDSFKAVGNLNGFPFCVPRVDVDSFDNWITLGGYSSTGELEGVTPSQIDLSLKNAMNLWWNFHSITGSYNVNSSNSAVGNLEFIKEDHILTVKRENETDDLIPSRRACRGTHTSADDISYNPELPYENQLGIRRAREFTNDIQESNSLSSSDGSNPVDAGLFIGSSVLDDFIVRMYYEGIFIGYGVKQLAQVTATVDFNSASGVGSTFSGALITVASYLNGVTSSGPSDPLGFNFDIKASEVSLGSMQFRSVTDLRATNSGSGTKTLTLDADVLSGTSSTRVDEPASSGGSGSLSTSISISLGATDFYTY